MKNTTLCYIEQGSRCLMLHRTKKENDLNHDKWIGVGGKFQDKESPEDCLLRETWEELGIPREKIRILGRLDFVAHRANFILHPVLALVEEEAVDGLHLNPDEVAEVFQVPLEHLRNEPPLEYHYDLIPRPDENFPYELIGIPRDYRWQIGGEDVPIYLWKGHIIWGLTGRITRHLAGLLGGEMG